MAIRFYRRVRILAGFRLNISKSGASISVGRKGSWITVGPRGRRMTVGLPGTGLYWTETATRPPLTALAPRTSSFLAGWGRPLICAAIVAIAWWLG